MIVYVLFVHKKSVLKRKVCIIFIKIKKLKKKPKNPFLVGFLGVFLFFFWVLGGFFFVGFFYCQPCIQEHARQQQQQQEDRLYFSSVPAAAADSGRQQAFTFTLDQRAAIKQGEEENEENR
jgi:hypothetical protein